ncbi:MAG: thioredoxin family protein [Thermomicrobiales bacterium]
MMARPSACLAAALLAALVPIAAHASAPIEYTDAAFGAAQAHGRTIVIESYAHWCLPCRIQAPIIDRLRTRPPFREILVLRIGEKTPNSIWRRFHLSGFGSLVVFKGSREMARGTPTTETAVTDLLNRGL